MRMRAPGRKMITKPVPVVVAVVVLLLINCLFNLSLAQGKELACALKLYIATYTFQR